MSARWQENRKIHKRIRITGALKLLTPARFGGGGPDELTDMPLLKDPASGMPLLPGASIAGAIRAYLQAWELGYGEKAEGEDGAITRKLFGEVVDNKGQGQEGKSLESYLIVEDAVAESLNTEFRPGVKIDPKTRTAAVEPGGGQLYDMELLAAGTEFPLCFELALPEEASQQNLILGLAVALSGLEKGEITLGARKSRGFGECRVLEWEVERYNLKDVGQLLAWIGSHPGDKAAGVTIAEKLNVSLSDMPDNRKRFCLEARFGLESSLFIRSGSSEAKSPDMIHLKSKRGGDNVPILSGTSLAGAIRARALKIANTIAADNAKKMVTYLFGPDEIKKKAERGRNDQPWASRAIVREREVGGGYELVQSRIRIDRFTGGVYPGALFEQQPVYGGRDTEVCISIELRNPEDKHIGLLLFILKDLWTGDLPLGGEASVGRGRLRGLDACLELHNPGELESEKWQIVRQAGDTLHFEQGKPERLEEFARAIGGQSETKS